MCYNTRKGDIMQKEELSKLIFQIKKYNLLKSFSNVENFEKWLKGLNKKQIMNFNSLNIEPSLIKFPVRILVNEDLLNCNDYCSRVEAMMKLKNAKDCMALFDNLCSLKFLKSKYYYEDINLISKASTARWALDLVGSDTFIKSKYHKKDLELIVSFLPTDFSELVAYSLIQVASCKDSIKSPYHLKDMKLIASTKQEYLGSLSGYPKYGLNNLALDKVSLNDKYHAINMELLAKGPIAEEYLYEIMTNEYIVNGKNYRYEVEALVNAKNRVTAKAIYYYIQNPPISLQDNFSELLDYGLDYKSRLLIDRRNSVKGRCNPKYLDYLKLLNKVDSKYVFFFESLISDKNVSLSKYFSFDLNLLLNVKNNNIFMDLYRLIKDSENPLCYHMEDAKLISITTDDAKRKLLLYKALEKEINYNHDYDMKYIAKLDLEHIDSDVYNKIYYYLFTPEGIHLKKHKECLEKLYKGELISKEDLLDDKNDLTIDYLNNIEINFNDVNLKSKVKILSRIKKIVNNNKRKN